MPVVVKCKTCGKTFKASRSGVKRDRGKFCSRQCYYDSMKDKVERVCEMCGKTFLRIPCSVTNGRGKYCSQLCGHWRGGPGATRKRIWQKRKNDLRYRLNKRIASGIRESFKQKNGRHWENLVGYKLPALKKRLASTMPSGYTWDDFMSGKLHIDHIIPKSAFKFTTAEELSFRNCWALSNLQLLTASENIKKRDKVQFVNQMAIGEMENNLPI